MLSICESIAVRVLSPNKIAYGVGTELRIITGQDELHLPWHCPRKIHGIDSNGDRLLVWGERYFMVLLMKEDRFSLLSHGKLSDWISYAKLLPLDELCLITAHSVAMKLKCFPNRVQITEKSSCIDKSNLYCSQILGDYWMNLVIFGGNAFGEVIIWKPNSNLDRAPILRRFSAHQGVVFSINIHPKLGLLTTTSDDRSVRFWRLGIENEQDINWHDISLTCYRSSYGHSARVFQTKIIEQDNAAFIASCGEDQCVCLWNSSGELIGKIKRQMGSVLDCDYESSTMTLFASTSSGNVFKHSIEDMFMPISAHEISFPIQDDYVCKAKFLNSTHIVEISNKNKLFMSDFGGVLKYKGNNFTFKVTVLEVFGSYVYIGGYKIISVYKLNEAQGLEKVFEEDIMDSVIRSIFPFTAEEVLVSAESGLCYFTSDRFATCTKFTTPPCKEKWITAALKIHNFLVLSNRQGNLFLYLLNNGSCTLMSMIKHIHGYLGVTQMLFEKQINDKYFFKTCGHDSTVKTVRLDETLYQLKIVHTENIPVAWIERIEVKEPEGQKTILGFNDNHFVIWEKSSDFLHQISCGGGHRCWDAKIDFEKNEFSYIYVKNKHLHFYHDKLRNVSRSKIEVNAHQWHVKQCNILKTFKLDESSSGRIIISGGEDNLLKFSKYDNLSLKTFKFVNQIFLHISSIKAIDKVNISPRNWLIFSAGGRAQICVSQINIDNFGVEEKCNFMLKSNDFDRKYLRDRQEVDFDPETRIMAIAVTEIKSQGLLDMFDIFTGCSDGYIRLFSYKDASITPRTEVFYGKCILHTLLVEVLESKVLITCATDGIICFWWAEKFSHNSLPFFKLSHHDSGINSVDIKVENDLLYIATGGDDQSVTVSRIKFSNGNFYLEVKKVLDFLHIAQVNGVYITDCKTFLYTTGVDQKVCKINLDSFVLEKSTFTCVADAKGLEIFESEANVNNMCVIYGCGLQMFDL